MHQEEKSTEKYLQIEKQKARCLSRRPLSRVVLGVSQPHIHRLRHSNQRVIHISKYTVLVGVRRITLKMCLF